MKESVIETPLIGSGSMQEAENRVKALLELGTSRGYLTYEELNERLPDEVVSPDKLDSLLMMIDEMGIKLIDEHDIGEHQKPAPRVRAARGEKSADAKPEKAAKPEKGGKAKAANEDAEDDDDDEAVDL